MTERKYRLFNEKVFCNLSSKLPEPGKILNLHKRTLLHSIVRCMDGALQHDCGDIAE